MSSTEDEIRAPERKFPVIGFALRDGHQYLIGDFDTVESTEESAKQHGSVGNPVHVYNDRAS